jgi:hypothetical protein
MQKSLEIFSLRKQRMSLFETLKLNSYEIRPVDATEAEEKVA